MKEYKLGEGLVKKGGLGSMPTTLRPPPPKGQGGKIVQVDTIIPKELWDKFHANGWQDIWCPNPPAIVGYCWILGVWTGPQHDLLCLKKCVSNKEANEWLSPEGNSIVDALRISIKKHEELVAGRQVCHCCGYVGKWYPHPHSMFKDFCNKCITDFGKEHHSDKR
jgi:hypothetical protein